MILYIKQYQCYIAKDKDGFITGFYPVLALTYDLLQDKSGKIFLQFNFVNGKKYTIPYLELIHLRLFYNKNDIFGMNFIKFFSYKIF